MRSRTAIAAIVLAATAGVAAGCGSSSGTSSSGSGGSGGSGGKAVKVALVLPGPINDKGFNQTGYMGLQKCKAEGAQTSYAENVATPDFVKTYQTLARANNVVIGHGQEFGDIANQVAPQFKNVKFVVTSNPSKPPNQNEQFTTVNSTQGAFLAGAVAGLATKTNKLGGIAGLKLPLLAAQMQAFEAGAKYVNPKATMKVVYLGTFNDVAKGKEAAQSLAASGVDVVYHIADAAGVGVINGAQAAGIKAVGWGIDQNSIAPKTVITSETVDQATEIARVCQDILNGKWHGSSVRIDGLRSGLIGISKIYNLPASVQTRIDQVRKDIESGKAKVPSIAPGIPGSGPSSG